MPLHAMTQHCTLAWQIWERCPFALTRMPAWLPLRSCEACIVDVQVGEGQRHRASERHSLCGVCAASLGREGHTSSARWVGLCACQLAFMQQCK